MFPHLFPLPSPQHSLAEPESLLNVPWLKSPQGTSSVIGGGMYVAAENDLVESRLSSSLDGPQRLSSMLIS